MQPLAPLDPARTRALTTIYAPRKPRRKNHTPNQKMLDNELPRKPNISPFHPLPAIGQKEIPKTKVFVFDFEQKPQDKLKLQSILKPLTPLRIQGFVKKNPEEEKPQQLLRENTYDVIEPLFVNAAKVKKKEPVSPDSQVSPKTRFKNAALQVAKLSSTPETGKLLCLRERETFTFCHRPDESCRLQQLPPSPERNLNKLSEIFQSLDMKGRHRDKMKKENSWF